MNDIHYIRTKFWRIDDCRENYPSKCYRMLTEKGTFYFLENQFKDFSVLNKLKKGDEIYIGSHQLDDGTYWLHWLFSYQKGELAIRQKFKCVLFINITLLLLITVLKLSIFNLSQVPLILGVILYLFVIIELFQLYYLVGHFLSPKQWRLRNAFTKVNAGNLAFIDFNNDNYHCDSLLFIDTNINSNFRLLKGKVFFVSMNVIHRAKRQSVLNIQFVVNDQTICFKENESSLNNFFVSNSYYRTHPTFIKEGDLLTILLKNEDALAIINHTDNASYLISKSGFLSKTRARTILINLFSILIPTILSFPFLMILVESKIYVLGYIIASSIILFTIPLFLLLYKFCDLFIDHSAIKYARSWLKRIIGNRQPKEI